jgi:Ca2+-transporting ATPase
LRILDVTDLKQSDPSFMRDVVTRTHVFARLNPTQKLQIIQAYQRQGIGVMMVGDGINDVLALKVADVGVAMGRSGTDLARKAADLVLEDDDLEAIVMALSSGRTFYENMRRSLHFLLVANHLNILIDLSARAGFLSQGFSPFQALWTNLACLSLASEPPQSDMLERPLPSPQTGLLRGDEWKTSFTDAGKVAAGSIPMALFGLMRYGAAPRVGQLFSRSLAVNQTLLSFHSFGEEGKERGKRPANTLLRLSLLGVVGSYFLSVLRPSFGKSLPAAASGLLNALALGGSALFSHALLKGEKRRNGASVPIPSSGWESNESSP